MNSIVVTGCNRGLGLGLVRSLVGRQDPPRTLIATCRDPDKAQELREIAEKHRNVHILSLNVRNYDSFKDFATQVSEIVKDDGLNVLFNNAGVSPKYTRINYVKVDQLLETFQTNTVAPIMLTKALLPLIKKASEKNAGLKMSCKRAAIINMSSILGSIESNKDGGLYPYKCSKAALNMATASLALDLKKDDVLVVSLHPGWVKTDMGGNNAPLGVDTSTESLVDLLHDMGPAHNGGFYQWDGKQLPW
ncbi:PREDICTED: C-factor [Nicrophorus vespilloides]|uniref:C-factor n=1 Tax=Nicrophorus vespilloides TaxID=110193 RepID=A0ABM1MVY5_NICVS|nr:PREDICTED: C-factor [Nicrophorus vespilloides]